MILNSTDIVTCKVEVVGSSISQALKVLPQVCSTKKDFFVPNAVRKHVLETIIASVSEKKKKG